LAQDFLFTIGIGEILLSVVFYYDWDWDRAKAKEMHSVGSERDLSFGFILGSVVFIEY
jgi:hypothetical protein